jgi:hypothetical protein
MMKRLGLVLVLVLVLSGCSSNTDAQEWKSGLSEAFNSSIDKLESDSLTSFYSYDDSSKIGTFYKDGYTFSFFNANFDGLPKCNFSYLPVTNYKDVTPSILYYVTQNNNIDELDAFMDVVLEEVGISNIFYNNSGYYIFNDLNETTYVLGFNVDENHISSYWRVEWDKGKEELVKLVASNGDIYSAGVPSFKTSYYYNDSITEIELNKSLGLAYNWVESNWVKLNEFSLEGLTEYDDNGLQKSAILTNSGKIYMMDNLSVQGLESYPVYELNGDEALDDKGNRIRCG